MKFIINAITPNAKMRTYVYDKNILLYFIKHDKDWINSFEWKISNFNSYTKSTKYQMRIIEMIG